MVMEFHDKEIRIEAIWVFSAYLGLKSVCSATMDFPIHVRGFALEERLEIGTHGELFDCPVESMEMKSCIKPVIIGFFLTGQSNIGPGCCRTISTVAEKCWPTTLISFGITFEDTKLLQGHCDAASSPSEAPPTAPGHNLPIKLARSDLIRVPGLETSGDKDSCLNSLMEFKSCSNDIVTFFVERQTNLGAGCCRTISTITHKCPPGVLGSIGLTIAEGNILQGHCDAATSPVAPPLTVPGDYTLPINSGFDLLPGPGTSGGQVSCLKSLMEMKSCSNEIATFFVARKINIGPGCCRTISTLINECWPGMLTSVGLSFGQGNNILQNHCNATSSPVPAAPPTSLLGQSAPSIN